VYITRDCGTIAGVFAGIRHIQPLVFFDSIYSVFSNTPFYYCLIPWPLWSRRLVTLDCTSQPELDM